MKGTRGMKEMDRVGGKMPGIERTRHPIKETWTRIKIMSSNLGVQVLQEAWQGSENSIEVISMEVIQQNLILQRLFLKPFTNLLNLLH